jgi:hypothetical protein
MYKDLNPQCLRTENSEKTSLCIGPTGYLRPCNYYATLANWKEFKAWAKENNLDIEELNVRKNNVNGVYDSVIWKKLLDGFNTGNLPTTCHKVCAGQPLEVGTMPYGL